MTQPPDLTRTFDEDPAPEPPAAGVGRRPGRAADAPLELLEEIAARRYGRTPEGRDPDIGRDVAVKVLLETTGAHTECCARFLEEAQHRRPVAAPRHRARLRPGCCPTAGPTSP